MRPQRDSAPPGRIGRGAEESKELGRLETNDSAKPTQVNRAIDNVLPFRRSRQYRCAACGNLLPPGIEAIVCYHHIAETARWNSLAALGLLPAGGC